MPKTKISEYSSTPSNNTDVNGINIAEGCAPSGINNAIRQLMSDLKNQQTGASGDPFTVGGNLSVTGTTTLTGAATAPTPSTSDNSTNIATTAYVTAKVAASTSGLSDPGANGIVVRTSTGTTTPRSIGAGTGITVSNGDGVSGNPTISLNPSAVVTSFNGSTGAVSGVTSVDSATGSVSLSSLSAFAKSLSSDGYQKLPGGLTIQWGFKANSASSVTVTFPTSFSSACYAVVATSSAPGDVGGVGTSVAINSAPTTTSVGFSVDAASGFNGFYWIAIGV